MVKCYRYSIRCGVVVIFLTAWLMLTFVRDQNYEKKDLQTENEDDVEISNYRSVRRNRNIASYDGDRAKSDYVLADDFTSYADDALLRREVDSKSPVSENKQSNIELNDDGDKIGHEISLRDVYISVKTTGKYHDTRLKLVIDTWFTRARNQTFFFTDVNDEEINEKTGGHLINTGCKDTHTRHDLSCKMGAEYDGYIDTDRKWWCHFDDDNYVNVDQLVGLLRKYDWREDYYIGRLSLGFPFYVIYENKREDFWFATGGAGLCISRSLAEKMRPWCANGELARTSEVLKAPDDCTLGFVAFNRLGVNLTKSDLLHSHLECLADLDHTSILKQVTVSYRINNKSRNVINLGQSNPHLIEDDPTKFRTFHCLLYPATKYCR